MKSIVVTGRTVDEAVTSALVRLGVTRSQATIRVIAEPVKGLFGFIGGKDAEVEVTVQLSPQETGKEFLLELLKKMGLETTVRMRPGADTEKPETELDVFCDADLLPVVIGRHGSTLDALQYLVNIVANRGQEDYLKFVVDAGDYRRRRKEGLCRLADRAAIRAVRTRKSVALDAMSAADRKVIHTYLQERGDVTTASEGVDPNRKVVVVPVNHNSGPSHSRSRSRSAEGSKH